MKYPKLSQPLLCKLTYYGILLILLVFPIVVLASDFFDFLPDLFRLLFVFGSYIAFIWFTIKNFAAFLVVEIVLDAIRRQLKVRTKYFLPKGRTPKTIENRLTFFGKAMAPDANITPAPKTLRYSLKHSFITDSKGFEKVVATYYAENLDMQLYNEIVKSAKNNSRQLSGTKKPLFLEKEQKKAPLKRSTVAIIFAENIDVTLSMRLYETVCEGQGDEEKNSFLPCIIDVKNNACYCDCRGTMSVMGESYALNRAVFLVKTIVFNGFLPTRSNNNTLPLENVDEDPEMSFWELLKTTRESFKDNDKEVKKQFEKMADEELFIEKDEDMESIFVKMQGKGVLLTAFIDEKEKLATITNFSQWDFPKTQRISKVTISEIKEKAKNRYAQNGYSVVFKNFEDIE